MAGPSSLDEHDQLCYILWAQLEATAADWDSAQQELPGTPTSAAAAAIQHTAVIICHDNVIGGNGMKRHKLKHIISVWASH